jgi:hypothetical protein
MRVASPCRVCVMTRHRERTERRWFGCNVPRHEDTIVVTEERPSRAHEVGQPVSELRNACPVHHDVECRPRWAFA